MFQQPSTTTGHSPQSQCINQNLVTVTSRSVSGAVPVVVLVNDSNDDHDPQATLTLALATLQLVQLQKGATNPPPRFVPGVCLEGHARVMVPAHDSRGEVMHLEMTGREWVIRLHDDLGGRDADLNGFAGRVLSPQEDSVIRLTVVEDARHFVAIRVHFCPRPIPAPDLPALDAQSPVHFCTQDPRARFSSLFSPPHNLARRSPFPVNPIPVALDPADATTCSTSPTRVAIGLAADCAYVDAAGGPGAALARILVVAGRVGQAYQTAFNIELVVTRVEIPPVCGTAAWNRGCALNDTLESRLQAFGQWRMGRPNDGVATWHLFTRCSEGATVGLAWYATLCETGRGFDQTDGPDLALARAVGVSVSSLAASGQEWQTMAHELGHVFGAIHDCDDRTCRGLSSSSTSACCPCTSSCSCQNKFLMTAISNGASQAFSPCSIHAVCQTVRAAQARNPTCFADLPAQPVQIATCGNGIVDQGEECDCGTSPFSPTCTTCCDPTTCRLRSTAQCNPTNHGCCTDTCLVANQTVTCRPSMDAECDQPESCDGIGRDCPADVRLPNGAACTSSAMVGQCASGVCTSRDHQCQLRGATSACGSSDTCAVACTSGAENRCVRLGGTFLDGTPCNGGFCAHGVCTDKSGSAVRRDPASSWTSQPGNLAMIVILSVIAVLILAGSAFLIRRLWMRRARADQAQPAQGERDDVTAATKRCASETTVVTSSKESLTTMLV